MLPSRMLLQPWACLLLMSLANAQSVAPQEQRIPRQEKQAHAALIGRVLIQGSAEANASEERPVAGAKVTLKATGEKPITIEASGDGIFRFGELTAGDHELVVEASGFVTFTNKVVRLNAGEVLTIEVRLVITEKNTAGAVPQRNISVAPGEHPEDEQQESYRELVRRPEETNTEAAAATTPDDKLATPTPDRWNLPMPVSERYDRPGEFPGEIRGRWFDPFNRNQLKGDKPIFGNDTFFNFTGESVTAVDVRRLYVPSNESSANPNSTPFFGNGQEEFIAETVRLS